jgi:hypothetical protein
MGLVDGVRWVVRGKDAGSAHSSAMGGTEDAVLATASAARRLSAYFAKPS